MVLSKILVNGFLLGFLIILPVSGFGVVSSPVTDPVVVDNIKPGDYYIDIATQSWQKSNEESSTNRQKLFINDFGVINQINPNNTGNSSDLPFDPNYGNYNNALDERTPIASIPEPMTILLLGLGSLGLAAYRRKQ